MRCTSLYLLASSSNVDARHVLLLRHFLCNFILLFIFKVSGRQISKLVKIDLLDDIIAPNIDKMGKENKKKKDKGDLGRKTARNSKKDAANEQRNRSRSESPGKLLSRVTKMHKLSISTGLSKMTTRGSSKSVNNNATMVKLGKPNCTMCSTDGNANALKQNLPVANGSKNSEYDVAVKDIGKLFKTVQVPSTNDNSSKQIKEVVNHQLFKITDSTPRKTGTSERKRNLSGRRTDRDFQPNPDEIVVTVQASEDDFSSDEDVEMKQIYPIEGDEHHDNRNVVNRGTWNIGRDVGSGAAFLNSNENLNVNETSLMTDSVIGKTVPRTNQTEQTVRPIDVQQIRSDPIFKEMLSQAVAEQIRIDHQDGKTPRSGNEVVKAGNAMMPKDRLIEKTGDGTPARDRSNLIVRTSLRDKMNNEKIVGNQTAKTPMVKSPSDMTIYAPAIGRTNEIKTPMVANTGSAVDIELINWISDFVAQMRLESDNLHPVPTAANIDEPVPQISDGHV